MTSAPARPKTCPLEYRDFDTNDLAPRGQYELLGHVVVSQHGERDPTSEELRAEVRPRACAMGGEMIGVVAHASTTAWALSSGGTTIDYAVVRRRRPSTKSSSSEPPGRAAPHK